MIVYNVTVKVEAAIAQRWLQWLQQTYAPEVLATGCFWKYQVLHLLEMDDSEGPTYAIQFYAHTPADYETYQREFAALLQQQATNMWRGRFVSFGTVMQVVS